MNKSIQIDATSIGIILPNGGVAVVDASDFELVEKINWRRQDKVRRSDGIVRSYARGLPPRGKLVQMHRVILNASPDILVDHRDLDGLNNRRSNLRFATRAQNSANAVFRHGASQYKGVTFDRGHKNPWRAKIGIDNRSVSIGSFPTEEDAARAYDRKAKEVFGEFALLNF